VPLKTETGGVVLAVNKARDALYVGIDALAGRTQEPSGSIAFKFPVAVQAT